MIIRRMFRYVKSFWLSSCFIYTNSRTPMFLPMDWFKGNWNRKAPWCSWENRWFPVSVFNHSNGRYFLPYSQYFPTFSQIFPRFSQHFPRFSQYFPNIFPIFPNILPWHCSNSDAEPDQAGRSPTASMQTLWWPPVKHPSSACRWEWGMDEDGGKAMVNGLECNGNI